MTDRRHDPVVPEPGVPSPDPAMLRSTPEQLFARIYGDGIRFLPAGQSGLPRPADTWWRRVWQRRSARAAAARILAAVLPQELVRAAHGGHPPTVSR